VTEIFHEFPQPLWANNGTVPQLGHDCFLSHPFQFILHPLSYYLMLYSLDTASQNNCLKKYIYRLGNMSCRWKEIKEEQFGKTKTEGCAIAQAVNHWLPIVAAQVQSQVRSWRICGAQSSTGAGLLPLLWFPLPILIPPTVPHSSSSSSSSKGFTIGPLVADVPSELNFTPSHEKVKR
jgi:hypothetical protein